MKTIRWIAAACILALGGALFLIPGALQVPGQGQDTAEAVGDSDFENLLLSWNTSPTADETPASLDEDSTMSFGTANWAIDYAAAFPESTVQRLDISMEPTDWESLLAQVSSSNTGDARAQPGVEMERPARINPVEGMGMPPIDAAQGMRSQRMQPGVEALAGVCADCEVGDDVIATLDGQEIPGTCIEMDGALVFQPLSIAMPGGMMMPNEVKSGAIPQDTRMPQEMQAGNMLIGTANNDLSYVPCTVSDGENTWEYVGIRFKGNSTLKSTASTDSWKYPLHLDFDEFEDAYPETTNQRFYGFDDLSFSSGVLDASFLRDYVSIELYQACGIPTPQAAYYQVTLDLGDGPELLGLYTMIEMPEDPMLEALFGDSDGNLYKPQGSGATWTSFDADSFEKKSNASDEDWSDIEAAIDALHASREDAASWRANLEDLFDVDGFLRWLALNHLLGNWDSYGQMAQNYYLYHSTSDDLLHWIPWDSNEALSDGRSRVSTPIDARSVGDNWPLISYLLDDPVYFQVYVTYVAEALDTVFDTEAFETLVQETQDTIAPYIANEDGSLSEHSFVNSAEEVENATHQLLASAYANIEEGEAFLESEGYEPASIVISEIYYNAPSAQGKDENYEFIELANRGMTAIDLSGYRIDDGIKITLPEGTWLEPNQCILLAKNATTYEDLSVPVLQWESGSLSNGGETIRLVDTSGFWVDCVTYRDEGLWPASADGDGASLELIDLNDPNHIAANWAASTVLGGTPGGYQDEI